MKKFFVTLLLFCILFCFPHFAAYADDGNRLSIISANVSGLPASLSKYDRDVPAAQKTLGEMLNDSGYDIICVQEDFGYHSVFAKEMTNYPYQTYTTGAAPMGDGLNIFSVYPIYNVERVTWNNFHGVFTDGSDALCLKGFIRCTVDVNGILIDLYNVHMDSYRTEGDQKAKKAQLEQLMAYIDEKSDGMPVLIVGDTNLTFHTDPLVEMHRILIEEGGFADCWIKVKNNGNYMQGSDGAQLIERWYARFGGHDWGRWDSVERVLYRGGAGLNFEPVRFEYEIYTDDPSQIKALTDHRMMECVLKLDTDEYERPTDAELLVPKDSSAVKKAIRAVNAVIRMACLIISSGIAYLAENYPIAFASAVAVVLALVAFGVIRRRRKCRRGH